MSSRLGEVNGVTKETHVHVKINLDGTGVADCSTGIPFLDHMLDVSVVYSLRHYLWIQYFFVIVYSICFAVVAILFLT